MIWLQDQFELSRGGSGGHVQPMEGIRGFAVFLVFLVHYSTLVNPWIAKKSAIYSFADSLHTIGNAGVDLFFVLSGYLIYGTLISRHQQFLPFIARRVRRIYPAFIAVFLVYLFLSFAFPGESKIPKGAPVEYLLMNFLLLPGMLSIDPMITVAWSLSYEMFYYLTMPAVAMALGLRTRSLAWRIVFIGIVAALTLYCATFGDHIHLIMFMAGMLLYEAVHSGWVRAPKGWWGLLALVAGFFATASDMPGPIKLLLLAVGFFVFCLTCFLRPSEWLAQAFSWTPMRWLGNMSYSYYLTHSLALKAGFLLLGKMVPPAESEPLFFLGMLPAMFALTLVPSAALFIAVERPLSLVTPAGFLRTRAHAGGHS